MKSEPKIVLVFLGVLLLGLGVVFLMLALESGPGDVNPIRLSFLLGSVGFSLSAGMVLGCLILMILSLVKLHCEGGLKGEFPSKSTQKQRLYASRVVGVLFIAGVISIHSVTMLSDHWPTNTPPKCLPGECVLGGVCTQKDCGSGTTESNCDCTCDVGFAGELCDICAENFEDGLTKCSRCQANYTGDDCRTLAYGHRIGGLREGFEMRDASLLLFPRCQGDRCGKDCEFVNVREFDRNGKYTSLELEYASSGITCRHHSDCATEWCQGVCRGTSNRCYSNADCGTGICERRFCSLNERWGVCEFECSAGFLGTGCQACPGQAVRNQTESNPGMMTFACSEKDWDRKGQCGLNLVGDPKCRCDLGWRGRACQCKGLGACTECAEGWLLNNGACEKCPVMYNGATDRFQACGGYIRGKCVAGPAGPRCECSWPFKEGGDGACSDCVEPFKTYSGGCRLP